MIEGRIDNNQALLSVTQLDQALLVWQTLSSQVSTGGRTGITVVFHPGITDARSFRQRIAAMGGSRMQLSPKDAIPTGTMAPYARTGGDAPQQSLFVYWRCGAEECTTLQFNPKKTTVTARGKRAAIDEHIQQLITFLGTPASVEGGHLQSERPQPAIPSTGMPSSSLLRTLLPQ